MNRNAVQSCVNSPSLFLIEEIYTFFSTSFFTGLKRKGGIRWGKVCLKAATALLVLTVVFLFLACSLPDSIQVRGNREVTIPMNITSDNLFSIEEMLEGVELPDGAVITQCPISDILTLVVSIPLYKDEIAFNNWVQSLAMMVPNDDPVNFPGVFFDFSGVVAEELRTTNLDELSEVLEGFLFREIRSQIYFYTNNMNLTEISTLDFNIRGIDNNFNATGVNGSILNIMTEDLPYNPDNDLRLTELINNRAGDLIFDVAITLNGSVSRADLDIGNIILGLEVVIWLPLEFIANPGGASFDLGSFMEEESSLFGDDLFGRDKPDEESFVFDTLFNDLELRLMLNKNPFLDGQIIVFCRHVGLIPGKLEKEAIFLHLSRDVLSHFNNRFFSPNFIMRFDQGRGFALPRDFTINGINIKANIDYEVSF